METATATASTDLIPDYDTLRAAELAKAQREPTLFPLSSTADRDAHILGRQRFNAVQLAGLARHRAEKSVEYRPTYDHLPDEAREYHQRHAAENLIVSIERDSWETPSGKLQERIYVTLLGCKSPVVWATRYFFSKRLWEMRDFRGYKV